MWLAPENGDEFSGAGRRAGHQTALSGAVVVVTGAVGAAGPAVVERLATNGAFVVAVDADESRLAPLIASVVAEGFDELDAPPRRLGSKNVPMPFGLELEAAVVPQVADIAQAARQLMHG